MEISNTLDKIRTIYRELFIIRFLHAGYEFPGPAIVSQNIQVEPDEETKKYFSSFNMGYRFSNNSLLCFVQTDLISPPATTLQKPHSKFPNDIRFRFLLKGNTAFFKNSYVVNNSAGEIYLFSNKINNTLPANPPARLVDILFLSRDFENHSIAKNYQAGTIVKKGTQLFGSIKPVLASGSTAETDTNFWKPLGPAEQFVNNADLVNVNVVNAEEKCFAVIDIYNSGTTNTGYNLFEADPHQTLRSPVYTIPFKIKEK